MDNRIDDNEAIDQKTSRSICDAVAQRLKENLRPERARPSSYLAHLIDELRRRENGGGRMST